MGGETSKRPGNYDESQMHEYDFEQTYRHRCQHDCENIPYGGDSIQIGVKVIQDTDDKIGEYYVMRHGMHRIYLTTNGDWNPDAEEKIEHGDNFGNGPAVMISGPPSHPVMSVFGTTDTMSGTNWTQMVVNNVNDLKRAINVGHKGIKQGRMAGRYGSLATNPLKDAPRDAWSPTPFSEGLQRIGSAFVTPIAMAVVDNVTFGVGGTLMQVTGLSDAISDNLQKLNDIGTDLDYQSSMNEMDTSLVNFISDPRTDKYYDQVRAASRQNAINFADDDYAKELGKAVNVPHTSQQEKIEALKHFQDLNSNLAASQKTKMFMNTVNTLKQVVGNSIPGWDWSQIDDGIQQASYRSPEATENVIAYFTEKLASDVMPVAQQVLANMAPPPPPQYVPAPAPETSPPPLVPPTPEKKPEMLQNPEDRVEPQWNSPDIPEYPQEGLRNVHFDKKARTEAYHRQQYGTKKGSAITLSRSLVDAIKSVPKSKWEAMTDRQHPAFRHGSTSINGDYHENTQNTVIHG